MKKVFAIFIILQLLTNHEAFAELVKVPFLFHHYNESKEDESIFHFLKNHYADNSHEQSDHNHSKLPFKHSDDGCSNHPSPNISVVIKTDNNFSLSLIEFQLHQIIISNDKIPSSITKSIWQPPKLA